MKHRSRLFGDFSYNEDQILTFPQGLLGFSQYKQFVLKRYQGTDPVHWLLSIDEGGPELALINPADVGPEYDLGEIPLDADSRRRLGMRQDVADLVTYAVVTLPENIKHMSMNLRTPILINVASRRGLQLPTPGLEKKPIRAQIYRDLIYSRPEDKSSVLVIRRKLNETVEIGDDVVVQVMEFTDGGVRLGISAPRSVKITRGDSLVTPKCETKRASEEMNVKRLEGIMGMHKVMKDPEGHVEGAVHPVSASATAAG